jgi:uncharacterized protein YkwD
LIRLTTGAHRASSRTVTTVSTVTTEKTHTARSRWILGIVIAGSIIGPMALAPAASASTTPSVATPSSSVALTITTVDKPWYTTERFYLGLVNCTRTGGWVLANGTCRGYGSGHYSKYVKPLAYSYGLSDRVSRLYSKVLATRGLCSHTADGDPGARLRRAGYLSYTWGENIGCRDGYSTAKAAVLASHRVFQSEKSTNGGHWRNIKSSKYRYIGIGIWRYGTRTRLVTDFYGW